MVPSVWFLSAHRFVASSGMKTLRTMFRGALAEARDVAWFWRELIGRGEGRK